MDNQSVAGLFRSGSMHGALQRALAPALSLLLAACGFADVYIEAPSSELAAYVEQSGVAAPTGRIRFLFDDMRGLSTDTLDSHAMPWKVVTAALVLERDELAAGPASLPGILQEYGFIVPTEIANWTDSLPRPGFSMPLGIVTGTLEDPFPPFRLEVANISCAACHAGVTYDFAGNPLRSVWLGQPNTSINFGAFTEDVFRGLRVALENPERLMVAVRTLYPDADSRELNTIRRYVLPAVTERVGKAPAGSVSGFNQGSSGTTNGLGSLKNILGLLPEGGDPGERGVVSIPDLAGVTLRSSLLADGSYGPKGTDRFQPLQTRDVDDAQRRHLADIISAFTISIMGVEPNLALTNASRVAEIVDFLLEYEAPPFPGTLDLDRAARGEVLYRESCSSCHGTYNVGLRNIRLIAYPNRLVPAERIGTDPLRVRLASPAAAAALNRSAIGANVEVVPTGGYVAPRLNGIWATAPYLHNGSVPTLWHLVNPDRRPARFEVGGHRLDFINVGIAGTIADDGVMRYAADYKPWASPFLYDTAELGHSNTGHETQFQDLTEEQKWDLLEYLKLL